ncbi:MAG: hypothetical protein HDT35_01300 [Clostridiales bacterium]|nr:hypothetical protein [Clostridiales bacterium]
MRTKQYISLLLAALMALTLTACGAALKKDKNTGMSIAPVQLSEEEAALAELLALDLENYHILAFQAKGAKTLQFNTYELVDGEWNRIQGGGGAELSAESGRIALTFGKMTDGVRLAFQTEGQLMSSSIQPEPGDDVSAMTFATSMLGESEAITLEEEIPLAVQIVTSKNEIHSYDVSYFGMPREYAKYGYEHVYAITVMFSAQELGSAPSAEPSPKN